MCTHLKAIVLPVALFLFFPIASLFISSYTSTGQREIDKGVCVCMSERETERERERESGNVGTWARDRRTGRERECVCV